MGKILLLSFENSEDDVISEILSILENKQMKICENRNKKMLRISGINNKCWKTVGSKRKQRNRIYFYRIWDSFTVSAKCWNGI